MELIRALGKLSTDHAWVCWIVGAPQSLSEEAYQDQLERLSSDLGIAERIRFVGQRRDVSDLLAAADIYCQPNIRPESFGITFIEALWAEVPVVTSAIGGGAEIVDESCGLLVPADDIKALVASLDLLVRNPTVRRRLGTAGSQRAKSLCDPRQRMDDTDRTLTDICA